MRGKRWLVSMALCSIATVPVARAEKDEEPSNVYVERPVPVTFRISYKMMIDPGDVKPAKACMTAAAVQAQDSREDKGPIGLRKLESEKEAHPSSTISFSGDLVAWVESGARSLLDAAGVRLLDPGPRVVVRLLSLKLSEETEDNSDWRGSVTLLVEVERPEGGSCWSSEYWGTAKNWGNPHNRENYRETINHALDRALADLVKDPGFADALCNRCR